eukprot:TRINITY_DN64221_c0_g1_i1.p1 TRINITY_DN64221_c0_g1~~TRINITY_DN64221_c0_g1_i1.p1  ORF type:complete len:184 (-),score=32.20 TRINITY_DN64221_c0_g1_i1:69-620(-)
MAVFSTCSSAVLLILLALRPVSVGSASHSTKAKQVLFDHADGEHEVLEEGSHTGEPERLSPILRCLFCKLATEGMQQSERAFNSLTMSHKLQDMCVEIAPQVGKMIPHSKHADSYCQEEVNRVVHGGIRDLAKLSAEQAREFCVRDGICNDADKTQSMFVSDLLRKLSDGGDALAANLVNQEL